MSQRYPGIILAFATMLFSFTRDWFIVQDAGSVKNQRKAMFDSIIEFEIGAIIEQMAIYIMSPIFIPGFSLNTFIYSGGLHLIYAHANKGTITAVANLED
jgi:hypothetical protein